MWYSSVSSVAISLSFIFRAIAACNDLPNWTSTSVPTVRPESTPVRSELVPGSMDRRPGMDGAETRRHLALPSCPCVSILGMTEETAEAARLENAIWPSSARMASASWSSKMRAMRVGSSCSSVSPVGPPPGRAEVMTTLSCHELAPPWMSARTSSPARSTSIVGSSGPASGAKVMVLGWSRLRLSCVATRLMSPFCRRMVPLGRTASDAGPLSSTSPASPKLSTKGYTARRSGPSWMASRSRVSAAGAASWLATGAASAVRCAMAPREAAERLPAARAVKARETMSSLLSLSASSGSTIAGLLLGCCGSRYAVPRESFSCPPTTGCSTLPPIRSAPSNSPE
mmetsp:Transcript_15664/g.39153  ORF Transcript_15664/g.39153 Transcript_15664/m.39153 type:complete len:342 (-) Transcript_15664:155-1180(-)